MNYTTKTNLSFFVVFQIACADIVERFHILLFLILIGTEGLRRDGGFDNWVYSALTIVISEVIVDWLKHAFITKFNRIPLSVYGHFKAVLRHDITSSRTRSQRKVLDHTHLLSRRLGKSTLECLIRISIACANFSVPRFTKYTFSMCNITHSIFTFE